MPSGEAQMQVTSIYILSGVPGSGKSSVATSLMRRFPLGLHISVDDVREWVVSGIAHPVPTWTEETARQFALARRATAKAARIYAEAGFAVAIDEVIFPNEAEQLFVRPLTPLPARKILLLPDLEEALARNAARTNKNFETALLDQTIRDLDRAMRAAPFRETGWLVLDTTNLSLPETVDRILNME